MNTLFEDEFLKETHSKYGMLNVAQIKRYAKKVYYGMGSVVEELFRDQSADRPTGHNRYGYLREGNPNCDARFADMIYGSAA